MSGKTTKAAGKQGTKNSVVTVPSAQVASSDVADGAGHEPSVVLPGYYIPVGSQPVSTEQHTAVTVSDDLLPVLSALPETDDVVALEVRAVTERGFWRCGRFWSHTPVHVFASDEPDGDNAANDVSCNMASDCFISHDDAERLKAEPNLSVKIIETEKG